MTNAPDFDREMMKKAIDESKNPEEMRKAINTFTEIVIEPTKNAVKVCLEYDRYIQEILDNWELENKERKLAYNKFVDSFTCSVLGNMLIIFNISEDEAKDILKQTIIQSKNIRKQKEKE